MSVEVILFQEASEAANLFKEAAVGTIKSHESHEVVLAFNEDLARRSIVLLN